MSNREIGIINRYKEEEAAAHEAFRQRDYSELAKVLFKKGEIALEGYNAEFSAAWDLKVYGSFNAAGAALESIGDLEKAKQAYSRALRSCMRLGGLEWQKNINSLKSSIQRIEESRGR